MSSAHPLHDLLEMAAEDTVDTGHPAAGRWLVTELERRGAEAMWEGACLLLASLAAHPGHGLSPEKAADRMRLTAKTAQPDVALVLLTKAAYQTAGRDAAGEVWATAAPELHRAAIMHWLIVYCSIIGYDGRRLSPAGTVALIRQAIPKPPGAAG
ncbi:hypothetical protein ACH4E7_39740 [Kitasatospora sp. NPDC018058]|uniref:hypothetical protein n=1 Tax=Kitasatospora sp. NPDC018058 TaxID=3364025 RepID=UPI0037BFF150